MVRRFASARLATSTFAGAASAGAMSDAGAVGKSAADADAAERFARIDRVLQAYVDEGRIAGAVLQVLRDGQEVYSAAVGWRDREARDPIRKDTIFRIASQTKALTSVAAMMLVEEGKLLLTDPVGKHLPEWTATSVAVPRPDGGYDAVPAGRAITVRDLMTHTSGIPYGLGPAERAWRDAGLRGWYWADRDEPVSSAVARMAALPMAAQPGEQFVYGYGTDVLGVIVEKLSGKSLSAFLDERLIHPLGMADTAFHLPPAKAARLATVYSADAEGIRRAPEPGEWRDGSYVGQGRYGDSPPAALSGGAGLLSTAADYGRFLEMLRRGGELDGRRYLSRKSVELMVSDHLADAAYLPGMGFGLGFEIRTDVGKAGEPGSKGEYGWSGAYHSVYWVDPVERLTVVYMTQLLPADGIDDHGKIRALVNQALD